MIEELIKKNRSVRRFYHDETISIETLTWLVNLARLSASSSNLQPLRYILTNNSVRNEEVFSCLTWAGYLKDWSGPSEGERPSAYIIILGDTDISKNFGCDHGIAAQNILLGAREKGLGGCMLGAIKKDFLREELDISERYEILLVIALGKPKEEVMIEDVPEGSSIKYWRDEKGVHHVPKRMLGDLIIDIHAE